MMTCFAMPAQNQHYVPQFILRQFLRDAAKEQVWVYDKHSERTFATSVKNIMAERRFNDFVFEEWIVSFEEIASHIENMVLPRYRKVIEGRCLEGTPEEKADLAFLIAFQFMRTKANRQFIVRLEEEIRKRIEASGGRMEDIDGWRPLTEDTVKQEHLTNIKRDIGEFAQLIAAKDLLLLEASPGREFYLGDNPVCLHNDQKYGPYGNLGLAVPGIQIYLPLTADLLLCAWCPSIIAGLKAQVQEARAQAEREAIGALMAGRISAAQMRQHLIGLFDPAEDTLRAYERRTPMSSTVQSMDFYNSLQVGYAHRYVVSKRGDFALAQRHNAEFPRLRQGRYASFS
jgi:hypothetical protein